jgi:hypothetical protein
MFEEDRPEEDRGVDVQVIGYFVLNLLASGDLTPSGKVEGEGNCPASSDHISGTGLNSSILCQHDLAVTLDPSLNGRIYCSQRRQAC